VTAPAGPDVERIRDSLRLAPLERARRQERRREALARLEVIRTLREKEGLR
jgi:hypothetical protein